MIKEKVNHIDCYILAGGKSSRMGTDKGLMPLKGKPLIERIIEQLSPVFERIIIVSNNEEYKKFGLEVIADLIKDIGPAGGIHAALHHLQAQSAFIISCDMPFITSASVSFMISRKIDSQITLPVVTQKIQPLFGVYSKDCLPEWERLLEKKIIKLQEMVSHFSLSKIEIGKVNCVNGLLFSNINDKEDFEKALTQM